MERLSREDIDERLDRINERIGKNGRRSIDITKSVRRRDGMYVITRWDHPAFHVQSVKEVLAFLEGYLDALDLCDYANRGRAL